MTKEKAMGVLDAIHRRRSVRSYKPDALDDATVGVLLDAAVRAPTALHLEPWGFAVVQDRALLKQISDRAKASYLVEDRLHPPHTADDNPELAVFRQALASPTFNIFYDAPTLIVICARVKTPFVEADCWLAAENLMLAACAMGLGSCVIGSAVPVLRSPAGMTELGISSDVTPIAPIIIGVPAEVGAQTPRRAPEILVWRRCPP